MQDKHARAAYKQAHYAIAPTTPEDFNPDYSGQRGNLKRGNINVLFKSLRKHLEDEGIKLTYEADPVRGALVMQMLRIALRDNTENPQIYCPECKRWHEVEATAPCPEHGTELPIKIQNILAEKNSIAVAGKVFDKIYPNLQSIGGTINIQGTITTLSVELAKVIVKFVPGEQRKACVEELDKLIGEVQRNAAENE